MHEHNRAVWSYCNRSGAPPMTEVIVIFKNQSLDACLDDITGVLSSRGSLWAAVRMSHSRGFPDER